MSERHPKGAPTASFMNNLLDWRQSWWPIVGPPTKGNQDLSHSGKELTVTFAGLLQEANVPYTVGGAFSALFSDSWENSTVHWSDVSRLQTTKISLDN